MNFSFWQLIFSWLIVRVRGHGILRGALLYTFLRKRDVFLCLRRNNPDKNNAVHKDFIMHILLVSVAHDRGAITDCFIRHLRNLDTTDLDVSYFFVWDKFSSGDDTDWRFRLLCEGGAGMLFDDPLTSHYTRGIDRDGYHRLAFLRNILRERALATGVDALVSIDSDICVPSDLLQRLAAARQEWVAALVDNSCLLNPDNDPELARMAGKMLVGHFAAYNVMHLTKQEDQPYHSVIRKSLDLMHGGVADAAGAVCWYSRELLEQVRWQWHPAGEDIGFSVAANAQGWRPGYIPLLCDHLMTPARFEAHVRNCPICN